MFHCYLDDFTGGSTFETDGKTVSEAEILEFALKYDPQPFHMDVEAAKAGPFGGLIASGVQTMAIGLRLLLQAPEGRGPRGHPVPFQARPGCPQIPHDDLQSTRRRRHEHVGYANRQTPARRLRIR